MSKFGHYYQRFDGVRVNLTGLPTWARVIFFLATLPGILLVALSTVALLVSVAALLLLAIPVYALLRNLTGIAGGSDGAVVYDPDPHRTQTKRVDVRMVDPGEVPDEVNGE